MSSTSKNVDRLSLLPDELLSHILSLMPTKSAVRTGTLSKRWRYTWTISAHLDFDFDHIHYFNRQFDINCVLKIVNGVLELCKTSQVKLLRLCVGRFSVPNSVLSKWINEAVRLNVCEVDIKARQIELPLSLFTCNTLTTLRLYASNKTGNLDVFNVPSNVRLPGLKTLEIYDSTKLTVSAMRLIHGCPVLESLSLLVVSGDDEEEYNLNIPTLKQLILISHHSHSEPFNKVVLNVPNLEYLTFCGDLSLLFVMEDLSSLVKATVSIFSHSSKLLIAELLKGVSGVKSLSWLRPTLDVFLDAPPPKFPNLKHLDFPASAFSRWSQVIEILERYSELEHLSIQGPKETCWIEPQSAPSCMVSNLRTIKISNWQGRNCDIEFLEYMLGKAEVLKRLTIKCSAYVKDELRLCAELLKFPRASRSCEIYFQGERSTRGGSVIEFLEYMLGNAEVSKKLTLECYVKDEMRLCAELLKLPRASRYCEIHLVGRMDDSTAILKLPRASWY